MAGGAAIALAAHNSDDKSGMHERHTMPMLYLLDSLLRSDTNAPQPTNPQSPLGAENSPATAAENTPAPSSGEKNMARQHNNPKAEIARIFMNAIAMGSLPQNDLQYAAQLVARTANIDQQTAEKRVADTFATLQTKLQEAETLAREAADTAREVSATAALWLFISLLIGAFVASLMAVYGGRQRDL